MVGHMKELQKNERKTGHIYGQYVKKGKKKKKRKISDSVMYQITLTNFQLHLYQLICIINDINEQQYMVVEMNGSTHIRETPELDEDFKDRSKLNWDDPMDINSRTFRGRFLTIFLFYLVRRSHWMVKHMSRETENHAGIKKTKTLDKLIQMVDGFVLGFLSSDIDYSWPLQGIMEFLIVAQQQDGKTVKRYEEVREMLRAQIHDHANIEDGILVNNILKSAFALVTGSVKVKKTPPYRENFDLSNETLKATYLGQLGFAIYNRWEKEEHIDPLYEIFLEANPQIYTNIPTEESPEIALGIQAVVFLKFCCDDLLVGKYIDRLIRD